MALTHILNGVLFIKDTVAADPALQPGERGARKHVVHTLHDGERLTTGHVWAPPFEGGECPVIVADTWRMASFTEVADQDRHFHRRATEIYIVLSGKMRIEVDNRVYFLNEGDTLVVNPEANHEILRETSFLARVITVGGGETDDKVVV